MLDSLDLVELEARGKDYRRQNRKYRVRTAIIILILLISVALSFFVTSSPPGELYVLNGQNWQRFPQPTYGTPEDILISDYGTPWLATNLSYGLHYYNGSSWVTLQSWDFQLATSYVDEFTLVGEEVWATSGRSVIHFNGQHWTPYPDILNSDYAVSIAATTEGVLVIGEDDDLATFDGQIWRVDDLSDVLPGYRRSNNVYPTLHQVTNGSVWLDYEGLWQLANGEWSYITSVPWGSRSGTVLAANASEVWMQFTSNEIGLLEVSTGEREYFASDKIGVLPNVRIYSGALDNDLFYLLTSQGVYAYNKSDWHFVAPAAFPLGDRDVGSVTVDSGGRLWLAVYSPQVFERSFSTSYTVWTMLPTFGLVAGIFGLVTLSFFPRSRIRLQRAQDSREHLLAVLPALSEQVPLDENATKTFGRWRLIYFAVIVVFIVLVTRGASPIVGILSYIGGMIFWLVFPVIRRRPHSPRRVLRYVISRAILVTALVLAVIALYAFFRQRFNNENLTILLSFFGGIVVCYLASSLLFLLPIAAIVRFTLAHGNYVVALRQIKILRRLSPNYSYWHQMQGLFLLFWGHYTEAEQTLRDLLEKTQNSNSIPHVVDLLNLAVSLDEQKRHEESLPLIEAATKILPDKPFGYRSLADHYRLRGESAERALELTDLMLKFDQKPRFSLLLEGYDWGETLAVRAQALANVGHLEEAENLISQAFRETQRSFRPGVAQLHCRAASIALCRDDYDKVREHLQCALELDPNGAASLEAQAMLDKLEQKPII